MKDRIAVEKQSGFLGELIGIVLMSVGIFVALCLYSYSPSDPSLNSAGGGAVIRNYGGVIGSYLADLLISGFGIASYLVVGLLFLGSYLSFSQRRGRIKGMEALLLILFLVTASVLFQLKWNILSPFGQPILAGGLIGAVVGEQLRKYLSEPGSYILVISVGLLAFVWATKISLIDMLRNLRRLFAHAWRHLLSLATIYRARLQKWWVRRVEEKKNREKQKPVLRPNPMPPPRINVSRRPPESPEKPGSNPPRAAAPRPGPISGPPPLSQPSFEGKETGAEPKIFQRVLGRQEVQKEDQLPIRKLSGNYELPPLALLDNVPEGEVASVDEDGLKASSLLLENKLKDYGVEGRVTEIHPGPVVTMYEFEPAAGVKVNKITNLSDDLSLSMGGRPVRIVAPLPGKPAVGIEVPNNDRETVYFKEIVTDGRFQKSESKLALALGKNIEGVPITTDLSKMPHLLVAGATGAGKSVGLNCFIVSLLLKNTPEDCRFIFIDPKMLELSIYEHIPHLLLPVVTQPKKAAMALRWAVAEMERRYRLLSDGQVRNILAYNKKIEKGGFQNHVSTALPEGSVVDPIRHDEKLPYIVIIIDELADLMMVAGREVEEYITRLAQMARAAGIHMILATQRPSVDVITGIIKANFPSRISFKVTSKHDSRTILDTIGAEHLLGNGDMLFIPPGLCKQIRVHGAYINDQEIMRLVEHLKAQGRPVYNEEIMNMKEPVEGGGMEEEDMNDELYDQAVAVVTETRQASISMVQRRLRIGYNRAARMIERMEQEGIVSAPMGAKGREVLVQGYGTEG